MTKTALSLALALLGLLLLTGCPKKTPEEAVAPPPSPVAQPPKPPQAAKDDAAAKKLKFFEAFRAMSERDEHPQRRRFQSAALSDSQRAQIERIKLELSNKDLSSEKKIALLGEVGDIISPELVDLVVSALNDENEDVRISAMELLSDLDEPAMLPAIEKGMDDKSDQVRNAALASLYYVSDPRVSGILSRGLKDESELVRDTALEMIAEQPVDTKYQLYDEGIGSANKDVFMETIANLEDESNHKTILILFKGLKHSNEEFRRETNDALEFLISRTFTSYDEAVAWWTKNQSNYDDELFPKQL